MHLVAPLATGIVGATNGTAELYARGTAQRVNYWLDFEASQQIAGADLQLDSNGGAEVYVGQLVDVVVKDESGTVVRSFVAGSEAPAVEVRSRSFTGTHYDTGALAASNPTTLQAVLDAVKTSFGALDFNVLVGGVSTSVQSALGALTGVFYNVKAPAYGAVGNGTTDDTSAIQAAITACATAGGGIVFFPKGTYRTVAALTMNTKVSLMGAGATVSVLKRDHATNHLLNWTTVSSSERSVVSGLRFTEAQATSGYQVYVSTNNTDLVFQDCVFDGNALGTSYLVYQAVGVTGCHVRAVRCNFLMAAGQPGFFTEGGSTSWSVLDSCLFKITGAAGTVAGASLGAGGTVTGCEFNAAGVSSGTFYSLIITGSTTQPAAVVGCSFSAPGGGTHKVSIDNGNEYGNRRPSSVAFEFTGATPSGSFISDCSNGTERLHKTGTASTNAHTIPDDVGTYTLRYTNAAAQDLNLTTPAFRMGQRIRLFLWNDSGNNQAVVWVAGSGVDAVSPASSVTWNSNTYAVVDMEGQYINGKKIWWMNTRVFNQAEP